VISRIKEDAPRSEGKLVALTANSRSPKRRLLGIQFSWPNRAKQFQNVVSAALRADAAHVACNTFCAKITIMPAECSPSMASKQLKER
jgi:hypothetical protein